METIHAYLVRKNYNYLELKNNKPYGNKETNRKRPHDWGLGAEQNNTEYLTLANDKLPHIPVSCGLNVGDKVKILIIKEDKQ